MFYISHLGFEAISWCEDYALLWNYLDTFIVATGIAESQVSVLGESGDLVNRFVGIVGVMIWLIFTGLYPKPEALHPKLGGICN